MRRIDLLAACLLVGLGCTGAVSAGAETESAEPTREQCEAAVALAGAQAAALPADDLSRYFAERDLHQALVEAGNGEFDDCMDAAARATEELRERRHQLQPGERLKVLQPDELPTHDGMLSPPPQTVDRVR